MILDKKFNGILDQGSGALIAYEDSPDNTTLETGLEAIEQVPTTLASRILPVLLRTERIACSRVLACL